ncbi:MAG: hypothetical protein ACD_12C00768G0006 [uncultured bacterium]|nr:MAG: hypothetical protein ACD_12C00768G0006 [uncultured bacterium]
MRKNWFFVSIIFLSLILFFVLSTQAQIEEDIDAGFVSQDDNISCLLPTGGLPKGTPIDNYEEIPITLKGNCGSSAGCNLVVANTNNALLENGENRNVRCPAGGKLDKKTGEWMTQEECLQNAEDGLETLREEEVQLEAGQNQFEGNIVYNNGTSPGSGYQLAPGEVDITIQQNALRHVFYSYYAWGPPNVTETGTGGSPDVTGVEGDNRSQQLGEVNTFSFPTGGVVQEGTEQECVNIGWDPYGRVFDAVSLEPMSDIRVTMMEKIEGNLVPFTPLSSLRKNYGDTDIRGVYNIIIDKPGTFYLDAQPPDTHLFSDFPSLSPNYSLIYSDIYHQNQSFIEKVGQITHHDIPLQPIGKPYRDAIAEPIAGSLESAIIGSRVVFKGRVTFPYAKVCLINEVSQTYILCGQADKRGEYNLTVAKNKISQREAVGVIVEKVDLNALSKSVKQQNIVQLGNDYIPMPENITDDFKYQPILNYIEGYAPSPQSKVVIKTSSNDKTVYSTMADDSGFFTIYAKNLPIFEYYLEFTDKNEKVTKLSTSEFVNKNQAYLDSEKINLMQGTKQSQKIINNNSLQNNKTTSSAKKAFNLAVLVIILIISLLIIISLGLVFYIKKSKSY